MTVSFTLAGMSILGSQMMINTRKEAARRAVIGAYWDESIGPSLASRGMTATAGSILPMQIMKHVETQYWAH